MSDEHDHPHEEVTTTEITPGTATTRSSRSNLAEFIENNPMPNFSHFASMNEMNNRFKNVCLKVTKDATALVNKEGGEVDLPLDAYVSMARKKLGQGKPWSRGLVTALIADFHISYQDYVKKQAEKLLAEAKANAEASEVPATTESMATNPTPTNNMDTDSDSIPIVPT